MSRLQTVLLAVLMLLAAALLAPVGWEMGTFAFATFVHLVSDLLGAAANTIRSLPSWIWWVVFGLSWSFFGRRWGCCSARRCKPASAR